MPKAKSEKPVTHPALDASPSHLLHRALQLALDIYAETFGPGAITQRQYAVLTAVESQEGLTQTQLVQITGIDRSTLADMVSRMITKGLLEREKSATDARANAVRLSETGRVELESARPRMVAADARLLKLLPGSKRDQLTSLLGDLISAAEKPAKPEKIKAPKAAKPAKDKKIKKAKKAKKSD